MRCVCETATEHSLCQPWLASRASYTLLALLCWDSFQLSCYCHHEEGETHEATIGVALVVDVSELEAALVTC